MIHLQNGLMGVADDCTFYRKMVFATAAVGVSSDMQAWATTIFTPIGERTISFFD